MNLFATIKMFSRTMPLYICRNSINLGDKHRPIHNEQVHLHYWHYYKSQQDNLGDYLSAVIVEKMKDVYGIEERCAGSIKHLYAIGSILQAGYQNATVWGTGFISDPAGSGLMRLFHSRRMRKLDIRAVRGPLTRQALISLGHNCPEVYGDPAILLPQFYQPEDVRKNNKYVVVQHFEDKQDCENSINILTTDYREFINSICAAERVISSSLHGIILAEAYGVPAVLYYPPEAENKRTLFKYRDYYLGTGRDVFPIAKTIEEGALLTPAPLPDLSMQAQKLAEVFPKDLWEC